MIEYRLHNLAFVIACLINHISFSMDKYSSVRNKDLAVELLPHAKTDAKEIEVTKQERPKEKERIHYDVGCREDEKCCSIFLCLTGFLGILSLINLYRSQFFCIHPDSSNIVNHCYSVKINNCGSCQQEIDSAVQTPFSNITTAQDLTHKIGSMVQPVCNPGVQICIELPSDCSRAKNDGLSSFINYLKTTCVLPSSNSFRAGPKQSRLRNMVHVARLKHRKKKR